MVRTNEFILLNMYCNVPIIIRIGIPTVPVYLKKIRIVFLLAKKKKLIYNSKNHKSIDL